MNAATHGVLLAEQLGRLRRSVAPEGSLRESALRAIYVPLFNRLAKQALRAAHRGHPEVAVRQWKAPGPGTHVIPAVSRILVLKLDHLGDFILALPALQQLRQTFPSARITVVCGSWNRSWAEQSGLFEEVVPFDFFTPTNSEWRGAVPAQFAAFSKLPLGSFDLAIDLRHDPDTRILLSHVEARYRAGFCAPPDAGGDRLDLALPDMEHVSLERGTGRPLHAQLRLALLVSAIAETMRPFGRPGERLLNNPAKRSTGSRPYAVIAPGAGSPIRCWPVDRFAKVGKFLCDTFDLDLLVTGGQQEVAAGRALADALPGHRVTDLTSRLPLRELPDVIAAAALYVGLDSGTTHLAASLGVPTVAITSGVPSLDVWHASGRQVVVVSGEAACSPCYFKYASQCPFGVACLDAIKADHVINACQSLLAETRQDRALSLVAQT